MNTDNDAYNRTSNFSQICSASYYGLTEMCLSGNWNDFGQQTPKQRIIQCEYCRFQNLFEYKEFSCVKFAAPLKIAKPF